MQRVAVAVEAQDFQSRCLEEAEEVVACRVTREDLVNVGNVGRREEPSGVELEAVQAQAVDDLERFRQGPIVEDRVVDTQLHHELLSGRRL
jgi:hypothetical protein